MLPLPLIIRPFRHEDEPFVFSSWLHAHAVNRDFRVSRDLYYLEHHALIRELLSTDRLLIAVDPAETKLIFGWLAGGDIAAGRVLDYVFVKPTYRRFGVARRLLAEFTQGGKIDAYSHHGTFAAKLAPGAVYDPYTLVLHRRKGI